MPDYVCQKHGETLANVLKGGAGWCRKCNLFVQSANHPMPTLPPEMIAKREAARDEEKKTKKASSRKSSKAALASNTKNASGKSRKTKDATKGNSVQKKAEPAGQI